ncbi:MAG: DNA-binding protein [Mediterranea massiliensis]|nr:DNA-binding protein [Mediterranea massiliensis]
MVKSEVQHAFAVAQYSDVMTIEKFARHIATHGCVYSRADISAILYLAVDCMREMLLDGRKIRLGDLGDFSVSLSSKGAESADKFSSANISAVNVVWDCGQEFKNLLPDAEFNLVASRAAQAAVLKAIKSGSSVVDLGAAGSNVPSVDDEEPTDPSGPSTGGDDDDVLDPLG